MGEQLGSDFNSHLAWWHGQDSVSGYPEITKLANWLVNTNRVGIGVTYGINSLQRYVKEYRDHDTLILGSVGTGIQCLIDYGILTLLDPGWYTWNYRS